MDQSSNTRGFLARLAARRAAGARAGFTLIELMVVIVILGILAGMVVPKLMDEPDKAKVVKAKAQIQSFVMALNKYKLDNGDYPTTEQGLQSLVTKPATGKVSDNYPDKGYMNKIPKDPWGRDYVYVCPGEHGDFDIVSLGKAGRDGVQGKDGNIRSWEIE